MKKLLYLIIVSIVFVLSGCRDEDAEKEEAQRIRIEKTRSVLANSCEQDSDCIVTGCKNTLCRAMPEEEYCDHRLVIELDQKEDLGVVEKIVKQRLTVREAESLRLGGYSAGKWTVSFHSSQTQRERVEQMLETISMSGFGVLHANSEEDTKTAYGFLKDDPDVALRTMRGAGALLEKQIRSGDMLSKDDIRDTWESLVPALNKTFDESDIERLWAYDVVIGPISYLRVWPMERRRHISVRQWSSLTYRIDQGDLHVEGELMESALDTFDMWTADNRAIALMLGNEILAVAVPSEPIDDGKFDFVIHTNGDNVDLEDALVVLEAISKMHGSLRIDRESTKRVERDIACSEKFPRDCACIDGVCAWKTNIDYNACLYE